MKRKSNTENSMKNNNRTSRSEDSEEITRILNSLSESLQQIRHENEYNGEMKILMTFSKNNRTKYYTVPFEKDLDNLILRKKTTNKTLKTSDILLPHIQRQQSYIRINPPKN